LVAIFSSADLLDMDALLAGGLEYLCRGGCGKRGRCFMIVETRPFDSTVSIKVRNWFFTERFEP